MNNNCNVRTSEPQNFRTEEPFFYGYPVKTKFFNFFSKNQFTEKQLYNNI